MQFWTVAVHVPLHRSQRAATADALLGALPAGAVISDLDSITTVDGTVHSDGGIEIVVTVSAERPGSAVDAVWYAAVALDLIPALGLASDEIFD